jgi:hypothetical protein
VNLDLFRDRDAGMSQASYRRNRGPQLAILTRAIQHSAKAAFAGIAAQLWAASLLNIKQRTLLEPFFLIGVETRDQEDIR